MDPAKIKVLLLLPLPQTVLDVRTFLRHVGYYQRFIHKYAILVGPLTNLLKKD
jgi:hypothetical protein